MIGPASGAYRISTNYCPEIMEMISQIVIIYFNTLADPSNDAADEAQDFKSAIKSQVSSYYQTKDKILLTRGSKTLEGTYEESLDHSALETIYILLEEYVRFCICNE